MNKKGEFRRKIVSCEPVSLHEDQVTFECGHKDTTSMVPIAETHDYTLQCHRCANEWLEKAVAEEKDKAK